MQMLYYMICLTYLEVLILPLIAYNIMVDVLHLLLTSKHQQMEVELILM